MAVKPKTKPRRTQEERRSATKSKLLEAALDTLVDRGYAGFTTTEVCSRSGLSQGALFKHFPTKHALLAAMIEHLFAQLRGQYEARFREFAARGMAVQGLRLLSQVYADPRLLAAYDLYTASRTDSTLRKSLAPVVDAHVQNAMRIVAGLFGTTVDAAGNGRFQAAAELFNYALQGIALHEIALPSPDLRERVLGLAEELARFWLPSDGAAARPQIRAIEGKRQ